MKKFILLSTILSGTLISAKAQVVVADTVSTGAGYINQVWYSLESGHKTGNPSANWDIAINTNTMSAGVFVNDAAGTHLWKYPNGDETSFGTLDTVGIATDSSWIESYNSPENWEDGAFNDNANLQNQFDYGWGDYDMNTHNITANSAFVIMLSDSSYKKIVVEKLLTTEGLLIFKYANLDGSNEVIDTIKKGDYSDKNFAYYSLQNNQEIDLEPNSNDWDLLFTKYNALIPYQGSVMAYPVTGVLANNKVYISKVEGVEADTYHDYQNHTPDSLKNIIGYSWKSYDLNNNAYQIVDSTVFFVQSRSGNIWKVVFTGFGGSGNGNYIFNKEKLTTTAIHDDFENTFSLATYPNPVTNGQLSIIYNLENISQEVHFSISDVTGRILFQSNEVGKVGMNTKTINTQTWTRGFYFLNMFVSGQKMTHKIIIQ